jgi:hypothetical protein
VVALRACGSAGLRSAGVPAFIHVDDAILVVDYILESAGFAYAAIAKT